MQCDMCGRDTTLFKALIEGTELSVCKNCTKYGKPVPNTKNIAIQKRRKSTPKSSPQDFLRIVANYSRIIKQKREQLSLKQEELAQQLNEKLSIIHKLETNHFRPSIRLAKKIERHLKIKLIEKRDETPEKIEKLASKELTIGDMITIKTKKTTKLSQF